jgi:hypothetical protein
MVSQRTVLREEIGHGRRVAHQYVKREVIGAGIRATPQLISSFVVESLLRRSSSFAHAREGMDRTYKCRKMTTVLTD